MTAGQWLLNFFWNNTELLEGFNKVGGVVMAFIGAVLVAPQGSKHIWARTTKPFADAASAVRNLSLRFLGRSRSVTINVPSINVPISVGHPSVSVHEPWMNGYTLDQKVKWLKDRVERIESDWRARAANLDEVDQQAKRELKNLERRAFDEIARLQAQINEIESSAVQIDATGLPPIVAGIFLTGVPEDLATWGAAGWLVWIGMAALTLNAMIRSIKSKVWR